MIYLDVHPNEDDLESLFGGLAIRYPLPHGDFNFQGQWLDGDPIWIWGERKRLSDLVQSVVSSGRFLRQIQDARAAGFSFFFCIIEAIYRADPNTGLLQYRKGGDWVTYHMDHRNPNSPAIEYSRIESFLNQIDYYCGVRVRQTTGPVDTVRKVNSIYHMFQKQPEDHQSLKQFEVHRDAGAVYLEKPSLVRRVAKEFPSIGWERARSFDRVFPTLRDLAQAIVEEDINWITKVDGVGRKTAQAMIDAANKQGG